MLVLVGAVIGGYVSTVLGSEHKAASLRVFVSQAGGGGESGEGSCAHAHPLAWLNSKSNWGPGGGRVGPGMTVDLCGTLTQPIETRGSGEPGKPITIEFTSGSRIAMSGNGCPGSGCIDLKGGSEYITITSVAGYKGQIENTQRSYAREKGPGPETKGVLALGCKHCNVENLEIGPLYVSEKGDVVANTEIDGLYLLNEDGQPEYDRIQDDYFHDLGWAVLVQNGEESGHIYVEHNTFYHLTHGLAIGSKLTGASDIGEETFAHNRFYGDTNWEDSIVHDTNHVDGVHCFAEEAHLAHYAGLYIYDNYISLAGTDTTGPIFLEGSDARTPCADTTSSMWIFNNVLTGNTCCGLAGAFAGEVHTYNNTMIGEGPAHLSETGDHEICEAFSDNTRGGRVLTVGAHIFINNVVSSCGVLMSAERFLVAPDGMEHNLWANGDRSNEVFACEHGEVETDVEHREAFRTGEFGKWVTCMQQPETGSRYVSNAKLKLTGKAQAPLGKPESGSAAIGHGKNLSSLCPETPEEALCKNIRGETRPARGLWNVGAY